MTYADFLAWCDFMGWSPQEGARQLGLAKNTPTAYKRGTPIRVTVALACAALAGGLAPWRASET